jgi:hypothetical protein
MLISLEDAHVFYVSTFGRVDHLRQGMTGRYTGSYLDRRNGWRTVAILAEIGRASLVTRNSIAHRSSTQRGDAAVIDTALHEKPVYSTRTLMGIILDDQNRAH